MHQTKKQPAIQNLCELTAKEKFFAYFDCFSNNSPDIVTKMANITI